jgi:maleate isomerase
MADRKRVGILIPGPNTVLEADLHRLLPDDVTVHAARLWLDLADKSANALLRMVDDGLDLACRQLALVRPHVTLFACTDAGALKGAEAELAMLDEIRQSTGGAALSLMAEARVALRAAGAERVGIITPYSEEKSLAVAEGVRVMGAAVPVLRWRTAPSGFLLGMDEPESILAFAIEALGPDAARGEIDSAFISCANWRGAEIADRAQAALGVPVVTSVTAAVAGIRRELAFLR